MRPGLRKLTLTVHVTCSVGWVGAVAASLALGIAGLTSPDEQAVRAAYLMLEISGWAVLVPLGLASLLTGLIQSLGTTWGLFRHHWILFKLAITIVATGILLLYMQTLGNLADLAARPPSTGAGLDQLRTPTAVAHATGGLLLLLVATALSVYKPRGMTGHGRRTQHRRRGAVSPPGACASPT